MLGIALEGGGAKGAFHIGAFQACMELGYNPDAIAGTSIGAMNGAMFAQGDFEKAKELWENISIKDVFSPEDEKIISTDVQKLDFSGLVGVLAGVKAIVTAGGIDNTNMRRIIDDNINVDKLLSSPVDYGVVTFAMPEMRAVEIFKNEMGRENIHTYILASAAFPGFRRVKMGESFFVDGGVYDNCPVNMLLEHGCDKVIAVRTNAVGVTRYDDKDPRVITIVPSEDLGALMRFAPNVARHNIKLGYYDSLRALMGLEGRRYYFTDISMPDFDNFYDISDEAIITAAGMLKISHRLDTKRALFERVLPVLFEELKLSKYEGYDRLLLAMLENRAERCHIERLCLYTAEELLWIAMGARPAGRQNGQDKAIDTLLLALQIKAKKS
ncbi:MAG: patatin-like phospholipase family protein [Clostridiaceae bacterium]|nr:patatin-like phospholipase family protein [Clostridiaceae bacterium]